MIPLVVIELAGPGAITPYDREMVAACTASLRKGECALASPGPGPARRADAVARVTAESELSFEIRVTRPAKGSVPEASSARVLEFQTVDLPEERWRSVGIAIASTAEELSVRGDAGGAPLSRANPPPPSVTPESRPFRLAGGMLSGTGLASSRVRLGGWLEGSARWGRRGPYAVVFGRYATAPAGQAFEGEGPVELTADFATVGLGAGFEPVSVEGVALRFQAAGLAERFSSEVFDSSGRSVSSDARWLPGALAATALAWPETGLVGAVLGGEVQGLTGATAVNLDGESVGRNPTFRWGFFFGLELRP